MLIVGEGYAEQNFLLHLRSIYTANKQGPHLTIANARGKGAANVVDSAIARLKSFDSAGALFDTDTDWNDAVEARARGAGIRIFAATPCIEAVLLDIGGHRAGITSIENKRLFRAQYGDDAHRDGLISRHFPRAMLDDARTRVETLSLLIEALT
jgi:hypothetical protein